MDPLPPPFRLADPSRFGQELVSAGLTDVQVETVSWDMIFASAGHDAEPGSSEPASITRRGRMVMKLQRRRVEFIDEVTEYQPGRVVAHRTVEGPFPLNTACSCDPTPGGCRATVVGETDRPIGGVFAPLVEQPGAER